MALSWEMAQVMEICAAGKNSPDTNYSCMVIDKIITICYNKYTIILQQMRKIDHNEVRKGERGLSRRPAQWVVWEIIHRASMKESLVP